MTRDYVFRPMQASDLQLIRRWLETPEVKRWWGDPDEQFVLVSGDLDDPNMDQLIVEREGVPLAYLQCYRLSAWNHGFGTQPELTRGIDQFIGEPAAIGSGHGSRFIRQFCELTLQTDIPRIVTDPDPANGRAVRAYEKAGFAIDRMVETPDGAALLMVRDR